jgi:NTP pyrophosphatase (non-canonical NTP hydrolase)
VNKPLALFVAEERMDAVTADAVRLWGAPKQLRQLTEECGELIAAVNRYERGRITEAELASEIADVIIMAGQARRIIGSKVDVLVEAKLRRLELRITHAEQRTRKVEP